MIDASTGVTAIQPSRVVENGKEATLRVRSFGMTHPGRVRTNNEDQFLVAELTKAMHVQHSSLTQPRTRLSHEHGHMFLVADGMGRHRAGEQPSALTPETIEAFPPSH